MLASLFLFYARTSQKYQVRVAIFHFRKTWLPRVVLLASADLSVLRVKAFQHRVHRGPQRRSVYDNSACANPHARIFTWQNKSFVPHAQSVALLKFPATNPFRIVMRCSRLWPKAPAKSRIFPPRPTAAARSIASRAWARRSRRRATASASPARAWKGLRKSRRALEAGNSGTTMRLLAGILSGQEFRSTIDGDASLRRRPMRRVMDPLAKMGARIVARDGGFAPLEIDGARLSAIEYTLPVPSAQVKSAVLLAGLFAAWRDVGR